MTRFAPFRPFADAGRIGTAVEIGHALLVKAGDLVEVVASSPSTRR